MCNFNKHDDDTKTLIHLLITKCADAVGGANFLLGLIEVMKEKRPNPLMFKECKIESKNANIEWNKIVFKDKLDILQDIIHSRSSSKNQNFNILENESQKKKKKILNMVKALAPIEFRVVPKDSKDGTGFDFKVFEEIKGESAVLNPIFIMMFFCSTEYIKKALKYSV